MEAYKGTVKNIIHTSEDQNFKILILNTDDGELKCKGNLYGVYVGSNIEIFGNMEIDRYGDIILSATGFSIVNYDKKEQIYNFLASGNIKYIGKALARRIVDMFGDDTEKVLLNYPEKLEVVKGISLKKATSIVEDFNENWSNINNFIFLQELGFSKLNIDRIIKKYPRHLMQVINDNPYRLIFEVEGIGIEKIDFVAEKLNIDKNNVLRKKAIVLYFINRNLQDGNSYTLFENLFNNIVCKYQDLFDIEEFNSVLMSLYVDGEIYIELIDEQKRIYKDSAYKAECLVARKILSLNKPIEVSNSNIDIFIHEFESKNSILLDEIQKEAICRVLKNNFSVITGGPGTGKTTIIQVLLEYFKVSKKIIKLVAPTACAAKRMEEVTNFQASTIHRLLELKKSEDSNFLFFGRNADNKLEADVIIIDEASMVDIYLMKALLEAVESDGVKTQIVLVGDKDQLPSVGVGNVLADIINSKCVETITLEKIYRQKNGESKIISFANKVIKGEDINLNQEKNDDLFVVNIQSDKFKERLIDFISRISRKLNLHPLDIQILSPQWRGKFGVDNINYIIQNELNKSNKFIQIGDCIYKVGDKVIHTKNNYFKEYESFNDEEMVGVFNGEVGIVTAIDNLTNSMMVEYPDKLVEYSKNDFNEIKLAYSITVHKSQGSEYPAVIIILSNEITPMLRDRKLLYTAITRAKNMAIILAHDGVINDIINNDNLNERDTGLMEKIKNRIV